MTSFRYKALAANGALVSGAVDAPSPALAIEEVRRLGHYPISAAPRAMDRWQKLLEWARTPSTAVPPGELAIVTEELATLLNAGLELDRALQIVAGLGETRRLRAPLIAAVTRVRNGASLADALGGEAAFPRPYVAMVRAGETGGDLEAALHRLANYLTRANAVRDAILSALVYPAILLVASALSILFILVFVLPEFRELFAESGKALPLPTRIVIGAGDFVRGAWWLLLTGAIGLVFATRYALGKPNIRARIDERLLRLPVFGDLILKIEVERLCRTLAALLASGVALPSALAMSAETLGNTKLGAAVRTGALSLREGEGLASLLSRAKLFPAMTVDLVSVGEQASKLGEMLLHQADLYERSIRHQTDRLLALLVPALTVILGLLVAGLVGSILSAILGVNELAAP